MGLLGVAFRGWSVLLLAPVAALLAAAFAGQPLLAHWTQTFMGSAAQFLAQFFPLFLLGALFGKLMEDSGSVTAIAGWMTERLGAGRAMLAVVLAGALVTAAGRRRGYRLGAIRNTGRLHMPIVISRRHRLLQVGCPAAAAANASASTSAAGAAATRTASPIMLDKHI